MVQITCEFHQIISFIWKQLMLHYPTCFDLEGLNAEFSEVRKIVQCIQSIIYVYMCVHIEMKIGVYYKFMIEILH